jgi:hypothetical protein
MTETLDRSLLTKPVFEATSINPEFGTNYKVGYVGFTYSDANLISRGIAYFTRWARMSQVKVSHALLVSGDDECIEAHAQGGVQRASLSDYFNDEHCQIFFRKPVDLNADIAARLVKAAELEIGCKYDIALIAGHAFSNSHLGRLIREVFGGDAADLLCRLKNNENRWICSEFVAHCLSEQPEYHRKGILQKPSETIDPQELFEDPFLFEPWKNDL